MICNVIVSIAYRYHNRQIIVTHTLYLKSNEQTCVAVIARFIDMTDWIIYRLIGSIVIKYMSDMAQ